MKNKQLNFGIFLAIIGISTQIVISQGTFGNLNFESPNLPLNPVNFQVPIINATPGWRGYIGGGQVNEILFNTINIDAAGISLHSSASPLQPLQGNYSVFLQGSSSFAPTASATLAQTGQVPLSATSLRLYLAPDSSLQVTFGGQLVQLFQISATANYNIVAGDITMFAGITDELRFTALPNAVALFDNVIFSSQPIPEPSTLGLFGLGALLLSFRSRLVARP
jgi:hypothetical protein